MTKLAIKADRILVGEELEEIQDGAVLVEDGKIEAILHNNQVESLEDIELVEYNKATLLPGLIDCHNHLALDTRLENHLQKMSDPEGVQMIRALKTMKDDLWSGVTTARCLGDKHYIDVECREAQKVGGIVGPRLIVSGIGMRASHGHGYVGEPFDGPEAFRKQARENVLRGVDFLKIFTTKVINDKDFIYHFMEEEEIQAVVKVANSVGLKVACHCSGGVGLDMCLDNGVECLEHVYYITSAQVDRVKDLNRWVVYTPSYALNDDLLYKFSPLDKEGSLREREKIVQCLSHAIASDLNFGIGTDGNHGELSREMQYYVDMGGTRRDAIKGVTSNAARLCGISNLVGDISVGKEADLLVVRGNPLEDIASLKQVEDVYQAGRKVVRS